MNYRKKASRKVLTGVLRTHDLTISEFCKKHGFKKSTVKSVIHRYWGKNETPQGDVSQEILETLESYFEKTPAFQLGQNKSLECREA